MSRGFTGRPGGGGCTARHGHPPAAPQAPDRGYEFSGEGVFFKGAGGNDILIEFAGRGLTKSFTTNRGYPSLHRSKGYGT